MKTIIIDDNESAQESLEELIQTYCPQLTLAGKAFNIQEGQKLIEQVSPALVFLDVEMPTGTGFELLQQLPEIHFKVIFTTAHEKYALKAIKFSALDYLLKPIDAEELVEAVSKTQQDTQQNEFELKMETLFQNLANNQTDQKMMLRDKYGFQITSVKDIIRLEADRNYTHFFIKDQKPLLISKSLKDYEKLLPPEQFFRCHKSHIVNLNYLLRYDRREDDILIFQDGSKVPVSRRKLEMLLERIKLG
ncbi:MAG TPA: DNA-binding response regulator [Microscillaceae bacterium]|nr:DNA-binding response regulator [Microscillaceae bacterium]